MSISDPSILLIARVHGGVARAADLGRAARELAAAAAAEDGCVSYEVLETGEPGELVILSGWRDQAALRAHFGSDAYGTYVAAVTEMLTRPSDVVIHQVSGTIHPLADLSREPGRAS